MSTTETVPQPDSAEPETGRLDDASRLRLFSVLAVLVLYTEVAPMQYVMVSAALQKMSKSFPTVGADLTWSIIILGLIGAAATPLLGKMSDVWGKKRLLLCCGVIFVVGCLIDALTDSWALFLVGRGLQALAFATQYISYGLIRDLMPRKFVPVALGFATAGLGFSAVIAPLIAGALVDHFSWRAMFWFLAVFTLAMTPIVMLVVPESKLRVRERIDPVGAILLSAGVLLTLLYLDKGQDWGWGRPTALAWLIAGLLLVVLFVVVERRASHPIMDMRLLMHPRIALTLLVALFGMMIASVQSYALGYMTQSPSAQQLKDTVAQGVVAKAQETGTALPLSMVHVTFDPGYSYGSGFGLLQYAVHLGVWAGAVSMVFAPVGGLLARRIGGRVPAIIGLVLMAALGACYAWATPSYSWEIFLGISALFGIGVGFFLAAMPILIVEAVPAEQQGISVGMLGVVMNLGSAISLAVVTAMLNNNPVKANIDVGGHVTTQVIPQVFADHGYVMGFTAAAGAAVFALVIALIMRHGRTPAIGGA